MSSLACHVVITVVQLRQGLSLLPERALVLQPMPVASNGEDLFAIVIWHWI